MTMNDLLKDYILENGGLNEPSFLSWQPGDHEAVLDGDFSSAALRAIADHMDRYDTASASGGSPENMENQNTVRVRIAVAVLPSGKWNSCGWSNGKDKDLISFAADTLEEDGEEYYFVEATLPIPVRVHPQTIEADVIPIDV